MIIWQLGGYVKVILSEGVGKNGSTVAVSFYLIFNYTIILRVHL